MKKLFAIVAVMGVLTFGSTHLEPEQVELSQMLRLPSQQQ